MDDLRVDTSIAELVNDPDEATRRLGPDNAEKLEERIDALWRVDHLAEMRNLPGDLEKLSGFEARYSIKLAGGSGYRLILEPYLPREDSELPRTPNGEIDESQITSVTIVEVEDYHD